MNTANRNDWRDLTDDTDDRSAAFEAEVELCGTAACDQVASTVDHDDLPY